MKTKFSTIGILVLMAISTISCDTKDDTNGNQESYIPTSAQFKSLFADNLENQTQYATFDAGTPFIYTSPKGVKLYINGSCLKKNGIPVTGEVDLEYVELFERGNMLITNKPTMGIQDGQKRLLKSGGEFYINATQDGEQLTIDCGMSLVVPTSLTGGTDNEMLPFFGNIDTDGELIWEQAANMEFMIGTSQANMLESYSAFFNNFGWFNCDRFYNETGPKTTITSLVPQGYGNGNSFVFLATPDSVNSLGNSYGEFPVGLECYLIFVTEKDGLFRYVVKPLQALQANHTETFTLAETTSGTAAQVAAAINALP